VVAHFISGPLKNWKTLGEISRGGKRNIKNKSMRFIRGEDTLYTPLSFHWKALRYIVFFFSVQGAG